MAVAPYVPIGLQQPPCGENPWYSIVTEGPVHLRLLLWFREPRGSWLYVSHRGQRRKRKFIIHQKPDLCIDQSEDGLTNVHLWVLPLGSPGASVWIAWSETCVLTIKQPASPPVKITYSSCSGVGGYVSVGSQTDGNMSLALAGVAGMQDYIEGDANYYIASPGYFVTRGAGTYQISIYQTLTDAGSTSVRTGTWGIRDLSTNQWLSQQPASVLLDGQPFPVNASAQFSIGAGLDHFIAAYWIPDNPILRTAGTYPSFAYFRHTP